MKLRAGLAIVCVLILGSFLATTALATVPASLVKKLDHDGQVFGADLQRFSGCKTAPCAISSLRAMGRDAIVAAGDESKVANDVPAGSCKTKVMKISMYTRQFGQLAPQLAAALVVRNLTKIQSLNTQFSKIATKLSAAENAPAQCKGLSS